MSKAATMDEYDQRHTLMVGRDVKVKLLLGSASVHVRNVCNPGDAIPCSRIGLLSHGAGLRIYDCDGGKKSANESRRRTIKNGGPSENQKVPFHKKRGGREFVLCHLKCPVRARNRQGDNTLPSYGWWLPTPAPAHNQLPMRLLCPPQCRPRHLLQFHTENGHRPTAVGQSGAPY